MVRTKWCPKPISAAYGNTAAHFGTEANDNGAKKTIFDLPKRVKLKARRRFSEKVLSQTILDSPKPTYTSCKATLQYNGRTRMTASIHIRHKRPKSLHRILSKVNVNV